MADRAFPDYGDSSPWRGADADHTVPTLLSGFSRNAQTEGDIGGAAPDTFNVTLDKSNGCRLGLDIDVTGESDSLPIRAITGGLAEKWNADHPEQPLSKGDQIVEVNGASGDFTTMLEHCKNHTLLVMKVKAGFGALPVAELRDASLICQRPGAAPGWRQILTEMKLGCFVSHLACPVDPRRLDELLASAITDTEWFQPLDPRSGRPIRRKTAWLLKSDRLCNYCYGGVEIPAREFTGWSRELLQLYMPVCGFHSECDWPDSCSVNLYEDGRSFVGWHADNEDIFGRKGEAVKIISVSLGQARAFELRPGNPNSKKCLRGMRPAGALKVAVELQHGDVLTMEGFTQQFYQHRAPPSPGVAGIRVNITWRWTRKGGAVNDRALPAASSHRQ